MIPEKLPENFHILRKTIPIYFQKLWKYLRKLGCVPKEKRGPSPFTVRLLGLEAHSPLGLTWRNTYSFTCSAIMADHHDLLAEAQIANVNQFYMDMGSEAGSSDPLATAIAEMVKVAVERVHKFLPTVKDKPLALVTVRCLPKFANHCPFSPF